MLDGKDDGTTDGIPVGDAETVGAMVGLVLGWVELVGWSVSVLNWNASLDSTTVIPRAFISKVRLTR